MKGKLIILLVAMIGMAGCADMKAHWDELDASEKVVAGIVVGAGIIAASQKDVKVISSGCHTHGSRLDCPQ